MLFPSQVKVLGKLAPSESCELLRVNASAVVCGFVSLLAAFIEKQHTAPSSRAFEFFII
jgi:hypothetical protein